MLSDIFTMYATIPQISPLTDEELSKTYTVQIVARRYSHEERFSWMVKTPDELLPKICTEFQCISLYGYESRWNEGQEGDYVSVKVSQDNGNIKFDLVGPAQEFYESKLRTTKIYEELCASHPPAPKFKPEEEAAYKNFEQIFSRSLPTLEEIVENERIMSADDKESLCGMNVTFDKELFCPDSDTETI